MSLSFLSAWQNPQSLDCVSSTPPNRLEALLFTGRLMVSYRLYTVALGNGSIGRYVKRLMACLSVSVCVPPSVSVNLFVDPCFNELVFWLWLLVSCSLSVSVFSYVSLSVCLCHSPSLYLCVPVRLYECVSLLAFLSVFLYVCMSLCVRYICLCAQCRQFGLKSGARGSG